MTRPSPLAVVVLALLAEGPMHPYRVQQMLSARHKDQVANIARRNSVYQTIDRLLRAGLIEVRGTTRDQRRPERTVYQITQEGAETFRRWMLETLSAPAREYPIFPAVLSEIALLTPQEVLQALTDRAAALENILAESEDHPAGAMALPPVLLLEDQYAREMTRAELTWVQGVIDDLRTGTLAWSQEQMRQLAAAAHD